MYALVDKGLVIQIEKKQTPVHPSLQWVAIPEAIRDRIKPYYRFDGSTFQPPAQLDSETAWAAARMQRNHFLADCDWTQLPDTGLQANVKQAWHLYRQKLRDLPQNFQDPELIQWPEPPKIVRSGS